MSPSIKELMGLSYTVCYPIPDPLSSSLTFFPVVRTAVLLFAVD